MPDLTDEKLAEIETAARGADYGDRDPAWRTGDEGHGAHIVCDMDGNPVCECGEPEDAHHIATADPSTIVALVAEVRSERKARERVETRLRPYLEWEKESLAAHLKTPGGKETLRKIDEAMKREPVLLDDEETT